MLKKLKKIKDKKSLRKIRKFRTKKIKGDEHLPRIVLNESNRYLRAQAIDDNLGSTILFLTTENTSEELGEKKLSFSKKNFFFVDNLAKLFAFNFVKNGKKEFLFDRNGRRYEGKVKYFCESLKKFISHYVEKSNS